MIKVSRILISGMSQRDILEYYLGKPIPNGVAIMLTKLGRFHKGLDPLGELVPERMSCKFALHPDKWEPTFYSLTNKDSKKIGFYKPVEVTIAPGTLVGDMSLANQFYWTKDATEKSSFAKAYIESLQPYPVDLSTYRLPELLIL